MGKSIDKYGNPVFKHRKPPLKAEAPGRKVDVNRYCMNKSCGFHTTHWVDYFCPRCGTHHDLLYGSERDPRADMTREQIVAEYTDAGYPFAPSGIDPGEVIKQMSVQNMKDTWEERKNAAPIKASSIRM